MSRNLEPAATARVQVAAGDCGRICSPRSSRGGLLAAGGCGAVELVVLDERCAGSVSGSRERLRHVADVLGPPIPSGVV